MITLSLVIYMTSFFDRNRVKNERKGKMFVYLRMNNDIVRKSIRESGLKVCTCALNYTNSYLFAEEGEFYICGFNEYNMHCIQKAQKDKMQIVDCGRDVEMFINKVKAL